MKKNFLKLIGLAMVLSYPIHTWAAMEGDAREDITKQYLKNASFEDDDRTGLAAVTNNADGLRGYTLAQPSAWNVSGTEVTKLLITPTC